MGINMEFTGYEEIEMEEHKYLIRTEVTLTEWGHIIASSDIYKHVGKATPRIKMEDHERDRIKNMVNKQ